MYLLPDIPSGTLSSTGISFPFGQLQSTLCRVLGHLRLLQHKLSTGLPWAELNSIVTAFHSFPPSIKGSCNSPYVQDTLVTAKPKPQGHCQSSLAGWQLKQRNHLVVFKNSLLLQRPFPLRVVLPFKLGHSPYLWKPVVSTGFIWV